MDTSTDPAREKLEHETALAVSSSVMLSGFKDQDERAITNAYDKCRETTTGFRDSTLHKIKVAAADTDLQYDLLRVVTYDRRSEDYVLDWIALEPFRAEHRFPRIQGVLLSLDLFPDLAPQSDEERRFEQLKAITRVTMHFSFDKKKISVVRSGAFKNTKLYISDKNIRSLITTHEYPGFVADIIIERDLTNYAQIAGVITVMAESETSALTAGVL
jgi:hypothetical protein